MKSIERKTRSRTMWLMLAMLGGLALALPSRAHAQVGTVMAVPLSDYGWMAAQNAQIGNNVNFIALKQGAFGRWNENVAIVGVTQRNGAPASKVRLKKSSLGLIQQTNTNLVFINQVAVGHGNSNIADVTVDQKNTATSAPRTGKYFFCPLESVGPILQYNTNVVIITQVAVGRGNTNLALVGVTQGNQVKVPTSHAGGIVQSNTNVAVITQTAVGSDNSNVAVLNVKQQNRA